ncbi:hypothetical protein PTSG_11096 [Salpingoeca rosetta]|uniref:Uncharacterized protein n=1 Tax=Salpingoeca rosetta (strain ATCC 50818 / BSB-021) TaxID=946362 RepID=F2US47_SALR5|nr:uncharacterized protein PTSG_11096 [Salpingoeca rosetta]EGD80452.1 hypothetical protein PTSG_11096 [Salpingoeca rosetta]|eukprot:XP_004988016.1 hypothetical protein PTSG_11096 [Salpingoeca rosetta]
MHHQVRAECSAVVICNNTNSAIDVAGAGPTSAGSLPRYRLPRHKPPHHILNTTCVYRVEPWGDEGQASAAGHSTTCPATAHDCSSWRWQATASGQQQTCRSGRKPAAAATTISHTSRRRAFGCHHSESSFNTCAHNKIDANGNADGDAIIIIISSSSNNRSSNSGGDISATCTIDTTSSSSSKATQAPHVVAVIHINGTGVCRENTCHACSSFEC